MSVLLYLYLSGRIGSDCTVCKVSTLHEVSLFQVIDDYRPCHRACQYCA